jgi:hypothetical protein
MSGRLQKWALSLLLGLAILSLFPQQPRGSSVAASDPDSNLRAESCARCHPREAEQWIHSIHASSHNHPLFMASFNRRHPLLRGLGRTRMILLVSILSADAQLRFLRDP